MMVNVNKNLSHFSSEAVAKMTTFLPQLRNKQQ